MSVPFAIIKQRKQKKKMPENKQAIQEVPMKKQNKLLSLLLSLFLLLFTLAPQSALTVYADANGDMAVHFIDIGQGNAILVQSGGQNLLYDGGDPSHADLLISYLQQQNV